MDFKKNDWIRPTVVIFLTFLKKITTTGSSAIFLSPKPNGQGLCVQHLKETFLGFSATFFEIVCKTPAFAIKILELGKHYVLIGWTCIFFFFV